MTSHFDLEMKSGQLIPSPSRNILSWSIPRPNNNNTGRLPCRWFCSCVLDPLPRSPNPTPAHIRRRDHLLTVFENERRGTNKRTRKRHTVSHRCGYRSRKWIALFIRQPFTGLLWRLVVPFMAAFCSLWLPFRCLKSKWRRIDVTTDVMVTWSWRSWRHNKNKTKQKQTPISS